MRDLQYFFRCPQCGQYEVGREVLEEVLTPDLKAHLATKSRDKQVAGFAAKFREACQRCVPTGDAHVQLVALRSKTLH